jgi:hypothetical protein
LRSSDKDKEDRKGRRIEAPDTTRAAATTIARLAWLASVRAPAGVCTIRPQTVAIVITKPDPIFRPMPVRQEIDREIGSEPVANIGEKEIQGIQRTFVAHGSFHETNASLA